MCPIFSTVPEHLTANTFKFHSVHILWQSRQVQICGAKGHEGLMQLEGGGGGGFPASLSIPEGGKIVSQSGSLAAYLDNQKTIRAQACMLLIEGKKDRCQECSFYPNNLINIRELRNRLFSPFHKKWRMQCPQGLEALLYSSLTSI